MSNIFLASDHHLGHIGVTQFLNQYGNKLRPWDTIEEMDEALIENHNKVVSPKDRVYFLGDVIINRKHMHKIAGLMGVRNLLWVITVSLGLPNTYNILMILKLTTY